MPRRLPFDRNPLLAPPQDPSQPDRARKPVPPQYRIPRDGNGRQSRRPPPVQGPQLG